ncbi:hypothetical protein, partial [Desulfovibrio piger]
SLTGAYEEPPALPVGHFLYAFVRHRPGGWAVSACAARLPVRIFTCGRALTGLESSVKGHRKKFFEIFFRKFFRRPPKNVMAQSCRKCAG